MKTTIHTRPGKRDQACLFGLVLALFLLALGCTSAPAKAEDSPATRAAASAGPAGSATIRDADLIPYNQQKLFLSGMNLAWINFANDLSRFNEAKFTDQVRKIKLAGGNTIRWWVFVNGASSPSFGADGKATGLPEEQFQALKKGLDIALQNGVAIMVCLFSFDLLQSDQVSAEQLGRNLKLLEDPEYTRAFIDSTVVPMVSRLRNHPAVVAWEVFNEPEGMTTAFGWSKKRTTIKNVQAFVNRVAGAIHRAAPGAQVTNGSWSFMGQTDVGGNTNYYRDDRLVEAGGDRDGTLDFYCVHYYPGNFDESLSPFHHPKAYWKLDKPLVIAEFPSKGIVPGDGQGFKPRIQLTTEEAYLHAIQNGYAGALSWTMTNHDGFGGVYTSTQAMSTIQASYPSQTTIDQSRINLPPAVTALVPDQVLNLAEKSWVDFLDFHANVKDREDGDRLDFSLVGQSNPGLLDLSMSKGRLSATAKATGSSVVTVAAKDSGGNETRLSANLIVYDPDHGNIAYRKPVEESSVDNADDPAKFVNDGNLQTRWSSAYKDGEWMVIDLQGKFRISKVILYWEAAYGKDYDILGSSDKENWQVLASKVGGSGGKDEVSFNPSTVRWVKFLGKTRGTQWGFSPWEMEVWGDRVQ